MNEKTAVAFAYAQRLYGLRQQQDAIKEEIDTLQAELVTLFPSIKEGVSPPFFRVSVSQRVVLDPTKAAAFYIKHKDLRCLFNLSLTKADFEKLGAPAFGSLKASSPTIKVDEKALAKGAQRQAA